MKRRSHPLTETTALLLGLVVFYPTKIAEPVHCASISTTYLRCGCWYINPQRGNFKARPQKRMLCKIFVHVMLVYIP